MGTGMQMPSHGAVSSILPYRTNTNEYAVRGVRDVELRSLTVGGYDRVLTDMIGMAASWEAKFPELVQRHCDAMVSLQS
jgi:hypothetical protein